MGAYYNEFDPKAAQWLRELIKGGHIADGDVDDRSITEVTNDDVKGYDQCHFFAGIGGWSLALRLAGWPDDRPVWTGSPPCQPFSAAGQRKGAADARNLWPVYVRLIAECHPSALFGEQVAAAISNGWLDAVFADLESEGYACAATVLPACSVGAPHIRQRLWIVGSLGHPAHGGRPTQRSLPERVLGPESNRVLGLVADANGGQSRHRELQRSGQHGQQPTDASIDGCGFSGSGSQRLADAEGAERPRAEHQAGWTVGQGTTGELGNTNDTRPQGHRRPEPEHDGMGDAECEGLEGRDGQCWNEDDRPPVIVEQSSANRVGDTCGKGPQADKHAGLCEGREVHGSVGESGGSWADLEWLACADGKARPTKPGIFPLAHGIPGRVGLLRGAGNAIVPQVAAQVIGAYLDTQKD